MITEDYISFETAKLLKEKGFKSDNCHTAYDENGSFFWYGDYSKNRKGIMDDPTLQMVMKWLREVHNLHINIFVTWKDKIPHYQWSIDNLITQDTICDTPCLEKYEEACEAAIKCCLKNLIKNEDEKEESDIPVPKTVEEAISTLEKILSDEDREYLLKNGAISMHHSLGTWIRNEWGLWTDSELKNELKKKGFEHPDDMSNYIIEEFIKYWNNKL